MEGFPRRAGVGGRRRSLPSVADPTTRLLLEAAGDEFIEHGYAAARVAEVGRRAGMSTGAIYSRWPSKPDLFVAALEHTLAQIHPERMLEAFGAAGAGPREALEVLGASLLKCNERRHVLFHAFGSARNNEELHRALSRFVNVESDQLRRMIDDAKALGLADPELSSVAMSLFTQAVGLGTHLLMSAGLEERNVPSDEDWNTIIARVLDCVAPDAARPRGGSPSGETQAEAPGNDAAR